MVNDLLAIIKKRTLYFFLFFPTVLILITTINDSFYFRYQDSKLFFYFVSYSLLFITTGVMVVVYHFVERMFFYNALKAAFRVFVIASALVLNLFGLHTLIVQGGIRYKSCGREFHLAYLSALQIKDPSFCFNSGIKPKFFLEPIKRGLYCATPNKDLIEEGYVESGCMVSFAKYTNDISYCEILRKQKFPVGEGTFTSNTAENPVFHCVMDYAVSKRKIEYRDLLSNSRVSPNDWGDKDLCIKIISDRLNDRVLCKKIEDPVVKESCLYRPVSKV